MRGEQFFNLERLEDINEPSERLFCGIVMQAVMDLRIPWYKDEINTFFHGPLVCAFGIDGDILLALAENKKGGQHDT